MSDSWFPDAGDDRWLIAVPDHDQAVAVMERIARRIADQAALPLSIELEDGEGYDHDELIDVAEVSLGLLRDTLSSDHVDEEGLDDLAAAANNLRVVAFAIALTDGGVTGDDGGVMGLVSYLSRLLEEAVGALDRSGGALPNGRVAPSLEKSTPKEVWEAMRTGPGQMPVFANGDISSPEKAREVLAFTGADGVMIGRASHGAPWIFRAVNARLPGNSTAAPLAA